MSEALLGVMVGGVIGALGSLAGVWLTTQAESRRYRQQLAYQSGMKEWELDSQWRKELHRQSPTTPVPLFPPLTYVILHTKLLALLDRGSLTPERVRQAYREKEEFINLLYEMHEDTAGKMSPRP